MDRIKPGRILHIFPTAIEMCARKIPLSVACRERQWETKAERQWIYIRQNVEPDLLWPYHKKADKRHRHAKNSETF